MSEEEGIPRGSRKGRLLLLLLLGWDDEDEGTERREGENSEGAVVVEVD